jgi:predicted Holliday junction resolvase-like endonuclease
MTATIITLVLSLVIKILPILYQFKILKSKEELEEFQRRVAEALKKAEENALDPIKIQRQAEMNKDDLDKKWEEKWGGKSDPK